MTRSDHRSVTNNPAFADAIRRSYDADKPNCQYGEECYRQNPVHFDEFRHPHLESELELTDKETSGNKRERDESSDQEDDIYNQRHDDEEFQMIINDKCKIPAQLQAKSVDRQDTACRDTWMTKLKKVKEDESFDVSCSKYGGTPYLLEGEEDGIECKEPNCREKCMFFFQLRSNDLPEELHNVFVPAGLDVEHAMFQLWACPEGVSDHIGHPRWIDASKPSTQAERKLDQFDDDNIVNGGEQKVVGWKKRRDYPDAQDAERWGFSQSESEEHGDDMNPLAGDKLSGFPKWICEPDKYKCSICDESMELFNQLDSDQFDTVLSDGLCHVMVCPTHRAEVKFRHHVPG